MVAVAVVLLSKKDARALTERIQMATEELAAMLVEAHEGEAWRALGYTSWSAYIDGEFDFSRSRSYQLLDQGRINAFLTEATGREVRLSEGATRELKRRPAALPVVAAKIEAGASATSAYQLALAEQRKAEAAAEAYRAAHEPTVTGKKRRGYVPPTEQLRGWTRIAEGWQEMMAGEEIEPEFARAGRRHATLFVEIFGLD